MLKNFSEKITKHLEIRISDEYNKRNRYRNAIYNPALDSIENNDDAFGTISDSFREIESSRQLSGHLRDIIAYIKRELRKISQQ